VHLKRLKILLQSKYLYYFLLIISIIYTLFNTMLINNESLYNLNDNNFIMKIVNIKETNNGKTITFKGKEKIISYFEDNFDYQLGDIVKVTGYLEIPSKNTIPNLFNYRKYLYNQGIFYVLNVEDIELVEKNKNIFNKIKTSFTDKINDYKSNNYLHAFILGNTSFIDDNIKDKYLDLGVNHLFAISGMHVSLLIVILSFIFDKLKFNKYHSFFINCIFLMFYAFLVNFQVSIIISFLSYICLSLNNFFKLKIKSEYIIIFIFSISLLLNPFNIFNLGFQYSYLISYILIRFNNLIKGNYFKKNFIVSFLAFIGSIPITIINNYQINLLTVFYNMIYVPLISTIIFPFSLLCVIFPFLDNIFYFFTMILEKMTVFISNYKLILILRNLNIISIIFYFSIILYYLNGLNKRKYFRFVYLVILIFLHYNVNFILKEKYVISFDVGQGDSLLMHSDNKSILIDTGGSLYKKYSIDLIDFMKSSGIRKVDYLILTHGDFDHMGEAIDLVENFKVQKVIFNCGEFNDLEQDLIKVLDKKKIPYYSCIKELNINDNKLYFLNNKDYGNENDNSSVIYTKLNNYKFLFMGDAGLEVEEDLIQKYNLQNIDVVKVGHHGSKTSSSKEFINEIKPKYGVISVGKNNRYGHPNNSVLDNLNNSKIYRTDQDGSIMFEFKNNKLKIETCRP